MRRPDDECAEKTYERRPRALIVDDDVESIQLLRIGLQNFGFDITTVYNGLEALSMISKKHFDLVFLDVNMPGMTGPQVLSKLEELKKRHPKQRRQQPLLPVITFSTYQRDEVKLPEQKGFYIVGHWEKPLSLPDLSQLISRAVSYLGLHLPQFLKGEFYETRYGQH